MSATELGKTVQSLVAGNKGILAIDESNGTCNKRFAALGIDQTVQMRRAWRELILTTPNLSRYIGGVILYDETIRQATLDGRPFAACARTAGMLVGIKVDEGAKAYPGHPGERLTVGLDGLHQRLVVYREMGASFAKWRAVFTIANDQPSQDCIRANALALARYAAECQAEGLVPIVEPEIVMKGAHSLATTATVLTSVLQILFEELAEERVLLEGIILKPAMALPGASAIEQATVDDVADATLKCLIKTVPAAVPVIAFLSGGQDGDLATARLRAMNSRKSDVPWALSFSFGRAIQQPALSIWAGELNQVKAAQTALLQRAEANAIAREGAVEAGIEARPAA